jgi:hypothetical protein
VLWLLLAVSASLALRTAQNASAIPETAQIQVLNGTAVPELARSVATLLRDRGLDVVSVGNADSVHYPETIVLLRRGEPAVADMVSRRLGIGAVMQQLDATLLVDVTVILGHDLVRRFPEYAPGTQRGTAVADG